MIEIPIIVENVWREAGYTWQRLADEKMRPSVLWRPQLTRRISQDPLSQLIVIKWAAVYDNFETTGETPEDAMKNFDKAWRGEE